MNCVNSTLQNCCTHPCNNDSDCITSGECDAENSLCRLNSDSIDWSRCGPGSQCADGEGDCDYDGDCLSGICGTDNCVGEGFDSTDDCCEPSPSNLPSNPACGYGYGSGSYGYGSVSHGYGSPSYGYGSASYGYGSASYGYGSTSFGYGSTSYEYSSASYGK